MLDLTRDALWSKSDLIKILGISRTKLENLLKNDPLAPKPEESPLGLRYLKSDCELWVCSKSERLRNLSNKSSNDANLAIAKAKGQ